MKKKKKREKNQCKKKTPKNRRAKPPCKDERDKSCMHTQTRGGHLPIRLFDPLHHSALFMSNPGVEGLTKDEESVFLGGGLCWAVLCGHEAACGHAFGNQTVGLGAGAGARAGAGAGRGRQHRRAGRGGRERGQTDRQTDTHTHTHRPGPARESPQPPRR